MADRFQVAGYGLRVWMYSVGDLQLNLCTLPGNTQLITHSYEYSITKSRYPGSCRFL